MRGIGDLPGGGRGREVHEKHERHEKRGRGAWPLRFGVPPLGGQTRPARGASNFRGCWAGNARPAEAGTPNLGGGPSLSRPERGAVTRAATAKPAEPEEFRYIMKQICRHFRARMGKSRHFREGMHEMRADRRGGGTRTGGGGEERGEKAVGTRSASLRLAVSQASSLASQAFETVSPSRLGTDTARHREEFCKLCKRLSEWSPSPRSGFREFCKTFSE
jgi:hypothetical protein